ncbi:MAG: carboxypeptidase-like regulatory domain-containing protein [Tannerellaceae bacterium]|jgi:hypothetical protein|nr:carboxypeptidase-like regulatory domain-containing protein [Tannerellaceae bacterium]
MFSPAIVCAQHTIKGKIAVENNEPIEMVSIVLLDEDSVFIKGTVSDKAGAFEMKGASEGNYILTISHIGYRSLSYTVSGQSRALDLGIITLEEDTNQMDEVIVSAAASLTTADRRILFPSAEQMASAVNSIALLSSLSIPRLIVNPATNSVGLLGNETVELRINNVVASNDEVRALSPNTIERIEYIDNPGLRYENVSVVLNYITKKQLSGGNVRLELNHSLVRIYGSDLLAAKINYKKSEFGFSYGNDFRDYYNYRRHNVEDFYFDNYSLKQIEDSRKSRYYNIYHNIVANYNITNNKTFLNVSMKYLNC